MLSGDFVESKKSEIQFQGISTDAFKSILDFVYDNKVNMKPEHLLEILSFAEMYDVLSLKALTQALLCDEINRYNAPEIFFAGHLYNCDQTLKEKAFRYIVW